MSDSMTTLVLAALLAAMVASAATPVEPVLPGGATAEDSPPPARNGTASGEATVPSLPVEWQAMSCELHLSKVGFGGVEAACEAPHHRHHHGIHRHHHHEQSPEEKRVRCCPVLATWLYAAQAEDHGSSSGGVSSASVSASSSSQVEMPVPPDDSAVCAAQLEQGLHSRGLDFPPLNASCDFSLCFCGIRLRQMASLPCGGQAGALFRNASASSPLVSRLLDQCSHASHLGCTSCIAALDDSMQWIESKAASRSTSSPRSAKRSSSSTPGERLGCRFMGLMWLLGYNRTRYIAPVSSVVRALLYNADGQCSPDESNLPLADPSSTTLQFYESSFSGGAASLRSSPWFLLVVFFMFLVALFMDAMVIDSIVGPRCS